MNYMLASSECSSGCESGWTLYLENSHVSPHATAYKSNDFVEKKRAKDDEEEEEDDLSMVSDASSGPPHFHEDEYYLHNSKNNNNNNNNNGCSYQAPTDAALPKKTGKRDQKSRENRRRNIHQRQPSLLDDTASSPIFNFSNNNFAVMNNEAAPNMVDFSQGYSTNHFEGRSVYQEHYGFYQSSLSGNRLQQNQWIEGKRW